MVNRRKQVQSLLQELGEATRRPLFVEIALIRRRTTQAPSSVEAKEAAVASASTSSSSSPPKKSQSSSRATTPTQVQTPPLKVQTKPDRQWHELLSEASTLLSFFTEEEHGELLRIASIMFLGFLLPHSTGNDFYLLQNLQKQQQVQRNSTFDVADYILKLELEERLAKSVPQQLSANEFGQEPSATLTDPDVEVALDLFLSSVAKILQARPAHRQQVDLLHLFAMAIDPNPSVLPIVVPKRNHKKNPAWLRAQRLMRNNLYAHQFQIHYGHRIRMVQLLQNHLFLPELNDMSLVVGPLLYGSLPHLRASLRAFADGGTACHSDAHLAHSVLVAIAVQSQNLHVMKEEWKYILNLMVDDFADYDCREETTTTTCHHHHHHHGEMKKRQIIMEHARSDPFCPHAARGELLSDFLLGACRSRQDADQSFLDHAVTSLTDAIEWQLDSWTKCDDDDEDSPAVDNSKENDAKIRAPCLLASLLLAANQLFYFQPSTTDGVKGDGDSDDDPYDTLIQCSIQLLRHPDRRVVVEAARLLVHAFSSTKRNVVNDRRSSLLLQTIKICLESNKIGSLLESLVSVASSQSAAFASAMYKFLSQLLSSASDRPSNNIEPLCRLLAAVSSNCPAAAWKDIDNLVVLLDKLPETLRIHTVSAVLSSRQARFFVDKSDKTTSVLSSFLAIDTVDNWTRYRLARYSLITGNFGLAADLLRRMLSCPLSEKHYIWISVLERVAVAELSLSNHAAIGIPEARKSLECAVSYLQSLCSFDSSWKESHSFQLKFLLLRLDFLDLTTVLRQLTKEMRLTGNAPGKFTRSFLHLRNVAKGFLSLSSRYDEFFQQYGIRLRTPQSRTCLCILRSLSIFLARATMAVFPDIVNPRTSNATPADSFACDFKHPMATIIRRLDELVVHPMEASLDPLVRAAAMLELINGVLLVPAPFPRDFFMPCPTLYPILALSADPTPTLGSDDDTFVTIEAVPSLSFSFTVAGHLPEELLASFAVPTSIILLWFTLVYNGPLTDDEENKEDDAAEDLKGSEVTVPDLSGVSPVSANLSRGGYFFFSVECPPLLSEGFYTLEVRLGCRDVAGSEWKIPINARSGSTTVRVSLSQTVL